VAEVIELHRRLFATWDEALARSLIERFEVPLGARIRTLSKGQARRVALLCAVAHLPEVLLLDEPASGLDPAARREFLETSIHFLNETGATILFSSHYMTDIERLADRVVMLHEGTVLLDDTLDDMRETFSLALVPRDAAVTRERLAVVEHCIAVRERGDAFHAVLRLDPTRARAELERELALKDVHCRSLVLEDMFVELVGGRS
jgi:ABC-2 type transport system ATP-binding protein